MLRVLDLSVRLAFLSIQLVFSFRCFLLHTKKTRTFLSATVCMYVCTYVCMYVHVDIVGSLAVKTVQYSCCYPVLIFYTFEWYRSYSYVFVVILCTCIYFCVPTYISICIFICHVCTGSSTSNVKDNLRYKERRLHKGLHMM